MRRQLGAVALAYAVASGLAVAAEGRDPSAKLNRWVGGTWEGTGQFLETPYSKPGTVHGVTRCSWSPDHVFVTCDQSIQVMGRSERDLSVYTYDSAGKTFRFFQVKPDGSPVHTGTLVIEGTTWTYPGELEDKGQKVQVRTLNVFKGPDEVEFRTEYSTDGKQWTPMLTGTNQRVAPPPAPPPAPAPKHRRGRRS